MPRLATALSLALSFCLTWLPAGPARLEALQPSAAWSSAEADAAWSLAWGDWDGDGDLDLATGSPLRPNRVYRNDGGGTLILAWSSPARFATTASLAWGDWDGDGDLDLALGNLNMPNQVYRNDGGAFVLAWESADSDETTSVAWGDCDGDGDLDLAAGNRHQPNRVYRNDEGALASVWTSPESDDTHSVAWGDWDGDGDLDLAAGNIFQPNRVYRNDGDGDFASAWASDVSEVTTAVAWADWDGDGDLDLAAGGSPTRVYANHGGALTSAWTAPEGDDTRDIAWGDWDGDGDFDLATGNYGQSRVYRNDGGTLTAAWGSAEYGPTHSVAWGDWDGDGDLELAIGNQELPTRVYVNGTVSEPLLPAWSSPASDWVTHAVTWGDWDRDGDLDLAVASSPNLVYRNDGGTLSLAWSSPESEFTVSLAWGDWDGDGDLDLAAGNYNHPNRVYRNDEGTLTSAWTSADSDPTTEVAWGDWDGDGDLDLAAANDGQPSRVYANDGETLTSAWTSPSRSTRSLAWGDWDGDGDLDLATGNIIHPNEVYRNDGGTLTLAWTAGENDLTENVAWGDLDGDGDLDLAVGNVSGPDRVYRNQGGTLTSVWTSETSTTYSIAWGDVDGDGDLDLVAGNSSHPNRVYRNDRGVLTLAWSFAASEVTNGIALGDWDGDGDLDLASSNYRDPVRVYSNGWLTRPGRLPETPVTPVLPDRPGATAVAGGFSATCLNQTTIPLTYRLFDEEGDPARRVRVEYATDGRRWLPATAAGGSGTEDLSAGPSGVTQDFIWDNLADGVLNAQDVALRVVVPLQASTRLAGPVQRAAMSAVSPPFSLCVPEADLAVTATDGVTTAPPGGSLTYLVTVRNNGPYDVTGARVTDAFPPVLACTWTCAGTDGATCTAAGSGGLDDTVDLPAGASVTYTAACAIPVGATGTLSNTAVVTPPYGVYDLVPGNDTATDGNTRLVPQADLWITKTDGVARLSLKGTTTYTISAGNPGPSPMAGATLSDLFPATLLDCAWTCTASGGAACSGGGPAASLTASLNLPAGSGVVYEVTCQVTSAHPTWTPVVNTATLTPPSGVVDPNSGNNSATDVDVLAFAVNGWDFYTLTTPCRLLDTRQAGQGPALTSGVDRLLMATHRCGIPPTARAISVNFTVVGATNPGNLTAFPADIPRPDTVALSFSRWIRTQNGVLPLALDGSGGILLHPVLTGGGTVHLIIDVVGYFE